MVKYCWLEIKATDWQEKKHLGQMICLVKGATVSLASCWGAMIERACMGIDQMGMPIGMGVQISLWVTLALPKGKEVFLSHYPEPEGKPLRLVWTELGIVPIPGKGGA